MGKKSSHSAKEYPPDRWTRNKLFFKDGSFLLSVQVSVLCPQRSCKLMTLNFTSNPDMGTKSPWGMIKVFGSVWFLPGYSDDVNQKTDPPDVHQRY